MMEEGDRKIPINNLNPTPNPWKMWLESQTACIQIMALQSASCVTLTSYFTALGRVLLSIKQMINRNCLTRLKWGYTCENRRHGTRVHGSLFLPGQGSVRVSVSLLAWESPYPKGGQDLSAWASGSGTWLAGSEGCGDERMGGEWNTAKHLLIWTVGSAGEGQGKGHA